MMNKHSDLSICHLYIVNDDNITTKKTLNSSKKVRKINKTIKIFHLLMIRNRSIKQIKAGAEKKHSPIHLCKHEMANKVFLN